MTINLTDPANHPANSPLTGERIERVIEALESSLDYRNGSSMDNVLADAVKGLRELRESREAVPVAVINGAREPVLYGEHIGIAIGTHLYAVPPAPGVPDTLPCPVFLEPGLKFGKGVRTQCMLDSLNRRAEYYAELDAMTPEQRAVHDAGIAEFKAMLGGGGRTAMLQSFGNSEQLEPVSNRDELPVIGWLRSDYNSDDKRDPNAPLFMLGRNDPSDVWGVKYIPLTGNSPVSPDGWIPVSERMPETDGNYWGWWSESKRQGPVWFIKSDLQAQFQSSEITHWQPLPSPPKEVG
ncbi:DUF551 domain-containing protein [Escherichia coli]|uniref:DUF551 domain-containing protein n=1 Tax=Escherichia coli TaxID=562 RepID=UPI001E48E577|nr:DUF551 domain-containing protein [Escherichia coli]MCC9297000.1 DUF551 domain-containing protein [Escherichia coli]MCC9301529.1 DUF551 domain-containing protein [Escherichia coli]MCZ0409726.1 DUF551 domain-containing protein [Escherichia coli]UIR42873.1 DUF551 domain-containing protein [Escherichia coli]UUF71463.1 DUF551 domain-containing protein [Escherichia coli]